MDKALAGYPDYYPIMDAGCGGSRERCRIFTRAGLLVSADGMHVTREGAIEMRTRMRPILLAVRGS
jgi:hypothetical protein